MTDKCDSYNKKGLVTTRVGNWVEEIALKSVTGQTRCEVGELLCQPDLATLKPHCSKFAEYFDIS